MRTTANNTRNLIQSIILVLMVGLTTSVANGQRSATPYKKDFIRQMIYQLSNEVMERT